MDSRGLGYAALVNVNPTLVYVATSPFGQDGPYSKYANTDLTLAALGGMAALNGDPDRAPVRISVPQSWHHAAAESAAAALIAHHRRLQTGQPQFVDVSVQAAVTWTAIQAMTAYAVQGKNLSAPARTFQLGVITLPLVFPALDGEVVLAGIGGTVSGMMKWMIEDGTARILARRGQLGPVRPDHAHRRPPQPPDGRTAREVCGLHSEVPHGRTARTRHCRRVTIAPVSRVDDVLRFPHPTAREYWYDYDLPGQGKVRIPGRFVWPQRTPLHAPAPAQMTAASPATIPVRLPAQFPRTVDPGSLLPEGAQDR